MKIFEIGTGVYPIPPTKSGGIESYLFQLCKAMSESNEVHLVDIRTSRRRRAGRAMLHESRALPIPPSNPLFRSLLGLAFGILSGLTVIKNTGADEDCIVHIHTRFVLFGLRMLEMVSRRTFHVAYTVHNPDIGLYVRNKATLFQSIYGAILEILAIRNCQVIIVLTPTSLEIIRKLVPLSRKLVAVIPMGVSIPEVPHDLANKLGSRTIICPARVLPQKNQFGVLKVAHHLKDSNCELIFTGPIIDPAYFDKVRKYAVADGLQRFVVFLGDVSRQELEKLFETSSVFLTLSSEEVQPQSVLEAASYRTPIVASDIAGIRDMAKGIEGVVLVNPEDSIQAAREIERLLDNVDYYSRLSNSVFSMALNYSWPKAVEGTVSLFDSFASVIRDRRR